MTFGRRCGIALRLFLPLSRSEVPYRAGSPGGDVVCNQPPGDLHPALVLAIKEVGSSVSLATIFIAEDVDLVAIVPVCSPHVQTKQGDRMQPD